MDREVLSTGLRILDLVLTPLFGLYKSAVHTLPRGGIPMHTFISFFSLIIYSVLKLKHDVLLVLVDYGSFQDQARTIEDSRLRHLRSFLILVV